MRKKKDGFEQREEVAVFGYWEDPRWKEVHKLNKEGNSKDATSLVMKIRNSYDVD